MCYPISGKLAPNRIPLSTKISMPSENCTKFTTFLAHNPQYQIKKTFAQCVTVVKSLFERKKILSPHRWIGRRECSDCYRRRSAHMPTTRGRQPLEVAQSQIRAIPGPASSQSTSEKHRQADFAIDKHNEESVLDRLNEKCSPKKCYRLCKHFLGTLEEEEVWRERDRV